MIFVHAATKSLVNYSFESAHAYTSASDRSCECEPKIRSAALRSAIAASAAGREDQAIAHARRAYEIRDPSCQHFFKTLYLRVRSSTDILGFREFMAARPQ